MHKRSNIPKVSLLSCFKKEKEKKKTVGTIALKIIYKFCNKVIRLHCGFFVDVLLKQSLTQ